MGAGGVSSPTPGRDGGQGAARRARSPHPGARKVCRGRFLGHVDALCVREAGKCAGSRRCGWAGYGPRGSLDVKPSGWPRIFGVEDF